MDPMKSVLLLRDVEVENANATAGITWGFPAITNFLGFTHAISRELRQDLNLTGCAVVCHSHQVHAYQAAFWGDRVLARTRNPVGHDNKPSSFVPEGRMHMNLSLLVACDFTSDDLELDGDTIEEDESLLVAQVRALALKRPLAGGRIRRIGQIEYHTLSLDPESRARESRRLCIRLLPGFALVARPEILDAHYQGLRSADPDADVLDALLDFCALKYGAAVEPEGERESEGSKIEWTQLEKPGSGWLVPIASGYKGISRLYPPGEVARARDPVTPFQFCEFVYTIGEWVSPHRIVRLEDMFWRYDQIGDWYLCRNDYQPASREIGEAIEGASSD